MSVSERKFGILQTGETVKIFHLENKSGAYAEVTDFGAILVKVCVPDKDGTLTDVVLGYDDLASYEVNGCFFGSTIGRNGNRIGGAKFSVNGKEVVLAQNENDNNLHSGPDGFEKKLWKVAEISDDKNSVIFNRISPDGENGFPGEFDVSVKYEFTEDNELRIHYQGICDEPTVANMTNHSYFNLNGEGSGTAMDQYLTIHAKYYTPVADSHSIPTGVYGEVAGTPMDFRTAKKIGQDIEAEFDQSGNLTFNQKVIGVFQLLKQKLSWNGEYKLYSENLEKVLKAGTGSNADLNFIFISMLRSYGIKAYPVVMSRRSGGMLPSNFPSLQKLNTFVVAIYDEARGKYVYLDSSMEVPALNVLPIELSVTKARMLSADIPEKQKWVNLQEISTNQVFMKISANARENLITGRRTTILKGHQALEHRKENQAKDSLVNKQELMKEKLTVTNLKLTDKEDNFTTIQEEFDFVLEAEKSDDHIYINPILFPQLTKNPFIQSERILPVEFPYPSKVTLSCALTLPEGYEVEEIPHTQVIKTEDGKLQCKYAIQRNRNNVIVNYTFILSSSVVPSEYYGQLQQIWNKAVEMNQALIVLKKELPKD